MIDGSPVSVTSGRIDAAAGLDLVIGNESGAVGPFVATLLNRGDGTFFPGHGLTIAEPQYILHTATHLDFNNDQADDLAIAMDDATTLPLRTTIVRSANDGSGNFASPQFLTLAGGGFPRGLVAADFTGDGLDDLVVADSSTMSGNGQVTLLRSVSGGAITADVAIPVGSSPGRMLADDLDGDGIIDLVVLDEARAVHILFGTGNGAFTAPLALGAAIAPTAVGILHDSGRTLGDLVLGTGSATLQILRQGAPRQFALMPAVSAGTAVGEITTADFDGDGIDDVVFSAANGATIRLWYGITSASGLTFGETVAIAGIANSLIAADLNGDGKPDLAVTSATADELFVILNGTNAPLTPTRTGSPTHTSRPTTTPQPTFTSRPTASSTPTATPSAEPSRTPTATASPTVTQTPAGPGDANCDGQIDSLDLPALIERLFAPGCDKADANADGKVSSADVTSLVHLLATR